MFNFKNKEVRNTTPVLDTPGTETTTQQTEIHINGLSNQVVELFPRLQQKYFNALKVNERKKKIQDELIKEKSLLAYMDPAEDFTRMVEREQRISELRQQAVEVVNEAKSDLNNITESEYEQFKKTYDSEHALLNNAHDEVLNDIDNKFKELFQLFNKKEIIERMEHKRLERFKYVESLFKNGIEQPSKFDLMGNNAFREKEKFNYKYKEKLDIGIKKEQLKVYQAYYKDNEF
ncbi:hypothetical protein EVU91_07975 [Macrococcoides bohemicum]|uniref:hypothetical protein n=1 Tax=Macrococcoides bohemicum TaxID=1903056 RepID=UPI001059E679|nr:hypothetical protein [Macrococcus bohemicus]TDL37024.1 hypothetical protein EVU91_07975 [Macrococcus bohemicus]